MLVKAAVIAPALRWPVGLPSGVRLVAVIGGAGLSGVLAHRSRRADAADRARALGLATGSRLPRVVRDRLQVALVAADVPLEPGHAVQVWLFAALAGACLVAGLEPVLVPGALGVVLVGGPVGLYVGRHRGARRRSAELPVALELVAGELRTGGTVAGAVAALGRAGGPLAAEFARIDRRCALGASLAGALEAWAGERSDSGVSSAAGALAVAASTGGRAADALDGLASSLRDRSEIAAEGRALSAQARLSAVVVGSLPVGYLVGAAIFDPRQVRLLTGTTFGLLCLLVGLILEALAALWIRALLRQDG